MQKRYCTKIILLESVKVSLWSKCLTHRVCTVLVLSVCYSYCRRLCALKLSPALATVASYCSYRLQYVATAVLLYSLDCDSETAREEINFLHGGSEAHWQDKCNVHVWDPKPCHDVWSFGSSQPSKQRQESFRMPLQWNGTAMIKPPRQRSKFMHVCPCARVKHGGPPHSQRSEMDQNQRKHSDSQFVRVTHSSPMIFHDNSCARSTLLWHVIFAHQETQVFVICEMINHS